MDRTREVRWFFNGRPPADVTSWFEAHGATLESTRTDSYVVSNDPALNVKLREGKIQTKHRFGAPTDVQFGPAVAGRAEEWGKWSFALSDAPNVHATDPGPVWVAVQKERWQRVLTPQAHREHLGAQAAADPCEASIELTKLQVGPRTGWTLCFETAGPAAAARAETFRAVGTHWLGGTFPHALPATRSFGYVAWLKRLLADKWPPAEAA
ncbi:hypothetical protein [Salisaeta longa]|uniref:hypothetical protein n=1 Tax=Salisaeta longa TaxID=503170 RepID=UPI0003B56FAF|nr:hypothetical protein [Salisaeta longa]